MLLLGPACRLTSMLDQHAAQQSWRFMSRSNHALTVYTFLVLECLEQVPDVPKMGSKPALTSLALGAGQEC